jgi:hypothetical protein
VVALFLKLGLTCEDASPSLYNIDQHAGCTQTQQQGTRIKTPHSLISLIHSFTHSLIHSLSALRSIPFPPSTTSPLPPTHTLMIFTLYIYDRRGKCLYYKEWNRPLNTLADDPDEERKLMFGMVYSLKELTAKISPAEGDQGLHVMKTDTYTLHHFESVTGMVFILNTDAGTPGESSGVVL